MPLRLVSFVLVEYTETSEVTAVYQKRHPGAFWTSFGDFTFVSGQLGLDPKTGVLAGEDISVQTQQAIENLDRIAMASGQTRAEVVKLTIYLVDLDHFETVNTILAQAFHPPFPARATVGVAALPKNAKIEIDAIIANRND